MQGKTLHGIWTEIARMCTIAEPPVFDILLQDLAII